MWKAGIALPGVLLFLVLMVWVPMSANAYEGASGLATPVTGTATPTEDATLTALNKEKLQKDIEKDQSGIAKDRSDIFWAWTAFATFISVIGGIITAFITAMRYFNDRRAEREKVVAERERQIQERFLLAVEGLRSER